MRVIIDVEVTRCRECPHMRTTYEVILGDRFEDNWCTCGDRRIRLGVSSVSDIPDFCPIKEALVV